MAINRYICIHGHFYQPPRENPWLEEIEFQDSAYPYRDWNERITYECYAPNACSRILDSQDLIINIVNNYAKMSFNFGPTLLVWLQRHHPDIYQAILQADELSQQQFSGHGSAIAQAYNHMIMPLANDRDKRTQIHWGIKDFEHHFKRKPEGMWLPETAVDTKTLEILAENKVRFTILSPHQALKIARLGENDWQKVHEANLNPQRPYLCRLPSGKEIVIFFYDAPIARDVAFGGLLHNGGNFANRLLGAFPKEHQDSRLVHVATDGETYGHHRRFGNMALAYCLNYIESNQLAQITNYGEFLDKNPPQYEVKIIENSSWSCFHGVERWRANCGCRIGTYSHWNQEWRAPLREALDWLRDQLIPLYERDMCLYFPDPWSIRDEYIDILLNRSKPNVENFFKRYAPQQLSLKDWFKILKILEMQRHAMLMYTSCGWFFDDISGIESTQIIQYAARTIQLAHELWGLDCESDFIKRLETAKSNLPKYKNGAVIYKKNIKPEIIDFIHVGAHYAITSVFDEQPKTSEIYSFTVHRLKNHEYEKETQKLIVGQSQIHSEITWEETTVDFSVLHLGGYNLKGGAKFHTTDSDFENFHRRIKETFLHNKDTERVTQIMDSYFGSQNYSLWDLFKNEQGKILNQLFQESLQTIESHFREIYNHYYPLMQIKPEFRFSLPRPLGMTVDFILNRDLIKILESDELNLVELERLVKEIKRWSFTRYEENLNFVASQKINQLMEKLLQKPKDATVLKTICEVLNILNSLSIPLDLWKTQNLYFSMLKKTKAEMKNRSLGVDLTNQEWIKDFEKLGKLLEFSNAATS